VDQQPGDADSESDKSEGSAEIPEEPLARKHRDRADHQRRFEKNFT